ncbi:MAG: NAD-dependent epimerase/dehydratase family protein [Actinomycetota bacterium]|nr:NAD-dependent epimerase/dehydratase family protein [Actinomycetota bacterium]
MRVVVTGGAGFIGANTARMLAADGMEVLVVDDLSSGRRDNLDGVDVDLCEGSVLDAGLLDVAVAGADAIIHLAAVASVPRSIADPLGSHHANVTGTLQVLEAARRHGNPQVIVASSSAVYGPSPDLPSHEGLRAAPISPYAVSKLATEAYAVAYAECYQLDVLALRFFNVFGPLQPAGHVYAAVVPAFIDAALAHRPVPIFGDGSQTRDFAHVDSVAGVLHRAVAERVSAREPVNLAFGTRTSLRDLLQVIEQLLGRPVEVEHHPVRAGDVPHSQADGTRLQRLFPGLEPLPLVDGVRSTIEWFQRERARGTH